MCDAFTTEFSSIAAFFVKRKHTVRFAFVTVNFANIFTQHMFYSSAVRFRILIFGLGSSIPFAVADFTSACKCLYSKNYLVNLFVTIIPYCQKNKSLVFNS